LHACFLRTSPEHTFSRALRQKCGFGGARGGVKEAREVAEPRDSRHSSQQFRRIRRGLAMHSKTIHIATAPHGFTEGDRVVAPARPGFPAGTVLKLMTQGYLLVRWDANVLESSFHTELDRVES